MIIHNILLNLTMGIQLNSVISKLCHSSSNNLPKTWQLVLLQNVLYLLVQWIYPNILWHLNISLLFTERNFIFQLWWVSKCPRVYGSILYDSFLSHNQCQNHCCLVSIFSGHHLGRHLRDFTHIEDVKRAHTCKNLRHSKEITDLLRSLS